VAASWTCPPLPGGAASPDDEPQANRGKHKGITVAIAIRFMALFLFDYWPTRMLPLLLPQANEFFAPTIIPPTPIILIMNATITAPTRISALY
jgi:hypothetical protein